jgi:hypothetical protein
MTIAACYLSADGVVFGADSTTTIYISGPAGGAQGTEHQYNFAQKIFQVGEDSTLGITMWGLGNLGPLSHRTLIARFADSLTEQIPRSMEEVASRWNHSFWSSYSAEFSSIVQRAQELRGKAARTDVEQLELDFLLQSYSGGFCLGGYLSSDRLPSAFEVSYDPTMTSAGVVDKLAVGTTRFWGCPNLINRLIYGLDAGVLASILQSGKWTGTSNELFELLSPHCLGQPFDLPIREAIDWVHASIYTTIKTMKFSHMAPVCGGPVEVAVITTDRRFRWVRHKSFGAAIGDGGGRDATRDFY